MTDDKQLTLKRLDIERNYYGPDVGKYTAKITYDNSNGSIESILPPDISLELLKSIGPMLNKYAMFGMSEIQQAIVNCTTPLSEPKEQTQ